MAQEWWLVRPVTPVLRGLAGSVARGRSHTGSPPASAGPGWVSSPLSARRLARGPGTAAGPQPSTDSVNMEDPSPGGISRHCGRPRTRARRARRENPRVGRRMPIFAPGAVLGPLSAHYASGSVPDRETRCCGPLRASNGGTRAVAGPEMSPAGHPPSAGPARSRTLQPLGERVNRTCDQSCSVRRRPLCDRREAPGGPAGPVPAGPASQLEAGQPPGLAVLTIQGVRRSLHAGLLPLPTQALDRPEPQLGPEAECVPTHPDFVRRKVGQDGPRLLLLGVPDRQQGATAFCGGCAESGPAPGPRGIRTGNEGARGQPPTALGAESAVFRIPHVGMPALSQDLFP